MKIIICSRKLQRPLTHFMSNLELTCIISLMTHNESTQCYVMCCSVYVITHTFMSHNSPWMKIKPYRRLNFKVFWTESVYTDITCFLLCLDSDIKDVVEQTGVETDNHTQVSKHVALLLIQFMFIHVGLIDVCQVLPEDTVL